MENPIYKSLIYNASLLLVMVSVFHFIFPVRGGRNLLRQVSAGLILGVIGIAVMETHWEFVPGIIFDTRTVLLGVVGLFFGLIPTLIAIFIVVIYRIFLGGPGLIMGVATIFESALIGLIWRRSRVRDLPTISAWELYLFGLVIHLVMLFMTWLLPPEIREGVLSGIWLPVIIIYPIATTIMGLLMSSRMRVALISKEVVEREQKARALFDLSFEFIGLLSSTGTVLDINKTALDFIGVNISDVINKPFWDTPWWSHSEATKNQIREDIKVAAAGKLVHDEAIHIAKDGSIHTIDFTLKPVKNEQGQVIFLIPEGRDITERKEAEEKLRLLNQKILAEKQKIEAILRDMGDAVFVTDKDRKITMTNKAMEFLFGLSERDMIGKNIEEVLILSYESSGEKPVDIIENVFEKKIPARPLESLVLNKNNGARLLIDGIASPIVGEQRELVGTVWVFRDVTREREIDKMKTDFISLASHQLRAPLTGIKWFVEMLETDTANIAPEKIQEFIKKIGISNNRLIVLVNDLLNTSRIESGRIIRDITKCSVKALLLQATEIQTKVLQDKNIEITGLDSVVDDLCVEVDAVQLVQVFGNLFHNAATYSPAGSTIEVRADRVGNRVKISVKDHGVGIPAAQQSLMFSKFFRADNVAKTTPGSGLGLYVAKSIVEGHGGKIWFESAENVGTTFFVELPLTQSNEGH